MFRFIDYFALTAFCSLIFWLSNQPSLPVPFVFEFQDKIHHMTAYFIMGVFAWRSFRHSFSKVSQLEFLTVIFCSLYGLSDEWHQSFVVGRSSEVLDWIADTFGAGMAAYLISRFLSKPMFFNLFQRGKTV